MPDRVIAAVERIAETDNQPLTEHGAPLFEWSPGVPIEDDELAPILLDNDGDPQTMRKTPTKTKERTRHFLAEKNPIPQTSEKESTCIPYVITCA
jgi:hypothetical protein